MWFFLHSEQNHNLSHSPIDALGDLVGLVEALLAFRALIEPGRAGGDVDDVWIRCKMDKL